MGDSYDEVMREALRMARPSRTPWVVLALVLGFGAVLGFLFLRRLDAARTEAAAATARALDSQESLAALRASKAELESRLEKLQREKSDLGALNDELWSDAQSREDELQKLKATFEELQDKLKDEIARGDVRLSREDGQIKLDVADQALFQSGEAQVSRRGEEVLSRVGGVLARMAQGLVQVAGHTDNARISRRLAGRFPTNWELSTARAITVVRFLEERARVQGARLVATGYGEHHPVSSNATASGRARNRRIEILVMPGPESPAARAAPKKGAAAARKKAKRR